MRKLTPEAKAILEELASQQSLQKDLGAQKPLPGPRNAKRYCQSAGHGINGPGGGGIHQDTQFFCDEERELWEEDPLFEDEEALEYVAIQLERAIKCAKRELEKSPKRFRSVVQASEERSPTKKGYRKWSPTYIDITMM